MTAAGDAAFFAVELVIGQRLYRLMAFMLLFVIVVDYVVDNATYVDTHFAAADIDCWLDDRYRLPLVLLGIEYATYTHFRTESFACMIVYGATEA